MHVRHSILLLGLLLACSPQGDDRVPVPIGSEQCPSTEEWLTFQSDLLGIALSVPRAYVPDQEAVGPATILYNDAIIVVHSAAFWSGQTTEPPSIRLLQSDDPRFLEYLAVDHALEPITFPHQTLQRIRMDGMGDPTGFLLRNERPFLAILFTFPPDDAVIRCIVESIRLMPNVL